MKKNIFGVLVSIFFCTSIHAQTFTVDGIKYKITDTINSYVEVGDNTLFSGAADIPTMVNDNNNIVYTVTAISDSAFESSSLTSVTIPDSVTSIGSQAFFECTSLTSVTIPDSVISIDNYAFAYSGLESVTIGNSVTSIGYYAFFECTSLESVTIGNSVTSIGDYAFLECTSLTNVIIPDSVISIGSQAFTYCTSLTSVTIGNSVTSIGYYAFLECTSLTSVTSLNPTPPTVAHINAFDTATYAGTLYVPAGSSGAYGAADFWKDFNVAVLNIEKLNEVTVMVYPNPVVETLYIQLQPNDRLTSATLHNIKGQKILKSTTKIIDLSSLTSGVYFATILTKNGKATKKIIK